ncbi:hypothetical protein MASR1M36_08750 [Candidatus Cloacimonadaceae bacterium]
MTNPLPFEMPVSGMPVSDRQGLPVSHRLPRGSAILALSPSPHSCESRNLLPQPLDPSTSGLFSRFSRVKGSGTFSLDEFCALTGIPQTRSVKILRLGEKQGIILCLASGFYLLKPLPTPRKNAWADWRPPRAKLQAFLDLIPLETKIENRTLIAASGLSLTAARRYLRILKYTGHVLRSRQGSNQGMYFWQKINPTISDIPSWQQVVEAASSSLPVSAVAKPPTSLVKTAFSHSTPQLPENQ